MLSLPPPPPPPPLPPLPLPPRKQTPLHQIVISKQAIDKETLAPDTPTQATGKSEKPPQLWHPQPRLAPDTPTQATGKSEKPPQLWHPQPRRTNPLIWCGAILCLIFSLVLIFFGIATLVIFLAIKPRNPLFDTPNANLNAIYFDSPEYFNGDFTLLANFSNPNRKIDVRYDYLDIELYFSDRLIATQALQPFTQRRGEARLESVPFTSSLVYLPRNLAEELRKQVQSNRIKYNIRATFRVRVTLGLVHYSYRLHSRCQLEMTGPPTGVLVARSCKTKR